jgi:hypothetical protein
MAELKNTQLNFTVVDEAENKFLAGEKILEDDAIVVVQNGYTEVTDIEPLGGGEAFEYFPSSIGAVKETHKFSELNYTSDYHGFTFNGDGSRVYFSNYDENKIYSYTLTELFNIETMTYDNNVHSINLDEIDGMTNGLLSIQFNSDGSKLIGYYSGSMIELGLSTPYDIRTLTFNKKVSGIFDSFNGANSAQSTAYYFKFVDNGMSLFMSQSNWIYKYTLTSSYDVSTMRYDTRFSTNCSGHLSFDFSDDGMKLFMCGYSKDEIFVRDCSEPYVFQSSSSVSANQVTSYKTYDSTDSNNFNSITNVYNMQVVGNILFYYGIQNSNTKMCQLVIDDIESDDIFLDYDFKLDVQNVMYTNPLGHMRDMIFNEDGTKAIVLFNDRMLISVTLNTPYVIGDENSYYYGVNDGLFDLSSYFGGSNDPFTIDNGGHGSNTQYAPDCIKVNEDGTKIFISRYRHIFAFSLDESFNLTTMQFDGEVWDSYVTNGMNIHDFNFNVNGSKLYVSHSNDYIYEYTLLSAYDIGTTLFEGYYGYVDGHKFLFSTDGTRCYALDTADLRLRQYDLKIPFKMSNFVDSGNYIDFDNRHNDIGIGIDVSPTFMKFSAKQDKLIIASNNRIQTLDMTNDNHIIEPKTEKQYDMHDIATTLDWVRFSADGMRYWTFDGDEGVYQWDLETAYVVDSVYQHVTWDHNDIIREYITEQLEKNNISISYHEGWSTAEFNEDGTRLIITDTHHCINWNFKLTNAFDITGKILLGYDQIDGDYYHLDYSHYSKDGMKYFASSSNGYVYQFNLTSAYDLLTYEHGAYTSLYGNDNAYMISFFSNDGTKLYIKSYAGNVNDDVTWMLNLTQGGEKYNLSDYDSANNMISLQLDETDIRCMDMIDDGKKLYVASQGKNRIRVYDLVTPDDFFTIKNDKGDELYIGLSADTIGNTQFSPDGMKAYVYGQGTQRLSEFLLEEAYSLKSRTTVNFTESISLLMNEFDTLEAPKYTTSFNVRITDDGTSLLIVDIYYHIAYRVPFGMSWAIDTLEWENIKTTRLPAMTNIMPQWANKYNLRYLDDGLRAVIIGNNNYVYEYSMPTPYEIEKLELVERFTASSNWGWSEYDYSELFFNDDKSKLYINTSKTSGNHRDYLYELILTENGTPGSLKDYYYQNQRHIQTNQIADNLYGFEFINDGKLLKAHSNQWDEIVTWDLDIPYSIQDISFDGHNHFYIGRLHNGYMKDFQFNETGTKSLMVDDGRMTSVSLNVAWQPEDTNTIFSITHDEIRDAVEDAGYTDLRRYDNRYTSFCIHEDGSKITILYTYSSSSYTPLQIDVVCSSPFNLKDFTVEVRTQTEDWDDTLGDGAPWTNGQSYFSPDGLIYTTFRNESDILQYFLAEPYNIMSATRTTWRSDNKIYGRIENDRLAGLMWNANDPKFMYAYNIGSENEVELQVYEFWKDNATTYIENTVSIGYNNSGYQGVNISWNSDTEDDINKVDVKIDNVLYENVENNAVLFPKNRATGITSIADIMADNSPTEFIEYQPVDHGLISVETNNLSTTNGKNKKLFYMISGYCSPVSGTWNGASESYYFMHIQSSSNDNGFSEIIDAGENNTIELKSFETSFQHDSNSVTNDGKVPTDPFELFVSDDGVTWTSHYKSELPLFTNVTHTINLNSRFIKFVVTESYEYDSKARIYFAFREKLTNVYESSNTMIDVVFHTPEESYDIANGWLSYVNNENSMKKVNIDFTNYDTNNYFSCDFRADPRWEETGNTYSGLFQITSADKDIHYFGLYINKNNDNNTGGAWSSMNNSTNREISLENRTRDGKWHNVEVFFDGYYTRVILDGVNIYNYRNNLFFNKEENNIECYVHGYRWGDEDNIRGLYEMKNIKFGTFNKADNDCQVQVFTTGNKNKNNVWINGYPQEVESIVENYVDESHLYDLDYYFKKPVYQSLAYRMGHHDHDYLRFAENGNKIIQYGANGRLEVHDLKKPYELITYDYNYHKVYNKSAILSYGLNWGIQDFAFSNDGLKMVGINGNNDWIYVVELEVPYDISTRKSDMKPGMHIQDMMYNTHDDIMSHDGAYRNYNAHSIRLSDDENYIFVYNHTGTRGIVRFDWTPWDMTTLRYGQHKRGASIHSAIGSYANYGFTLKGGKVTFNSSHYLCQASWSNGVNDVDGLEFIEGSNVYQAGHWGSIEWNDNGSMLFFEYYRRTYFIPTSGYNITSFDLSYYGENPSTTLYPPNYPYADTFLNSWHWASYQNNLHLVDGKLWGAYSNGHTWYVDFSYWPDNNPFTSSAGTKYNITNYGAYRFSKSYPTGFSNNIYETEFNGDGTKVFISDGDLPDFILEMDLEVPYDIENFQLKEDREVIQHDLREFPVYGTTGWSQFARKIKFLDNGNALLIAREDGRAVIFTLMTPYDLTTVTYYNPPKITGATATELTGWTDVATIIDERFASKPYSDIESEIIRITFADDKIENFGTALDIIPTGNVATDLLNIDGGKFTTGNLDTGAHEQVVNINYNSYETNEISLITKLQINSYDQEIDHFMWKTNSYGFTLSKGTHNSNLSNAKVIEKSPRHGSWNMSLLDLIVDDGSRANQVAGDLYGTCLHSNGGDVDGDKSIYETIDAGAGEKFKIYAIPFGNDRLTYNTVPFKLYASDDGSNWTLVHEETELLMGEIDAIVNINHRFIKLEGFYDVNGYADAHSRIYVGRRNDTNIKSFRDVIYTTEEEYLNRDDVDYLDNGRWKLSVWNYTNYDNIYDVNTNSWSKLCSIDTIDMNTEYTIGFSANDTSMKLFMNGVEQGEAHYNNIRWEGYQTTIGGNNGGVDGDTTVDYLRVFNEKLSDANMISYMNSGYASNIGNMSDIYKNRTIDSGDEPLLLDFTSGVAKGDNYNTGVKLDLPKDFGIYFDVTLPTTTEDNTKRDDQTHGPYTGVIAATHHASIGYGWAIYYESDRFYVWNHHSNAFVAFGHGIVVPGQRHECLITIDDSGYMRFYVDDVFVYEVLYTNLNYWNTYPADDSEYTVMLGDYAKDAYGESYHDYHFKGTIHEVKIGRKGNFISFGDTIGETYGKSDGDVWYSTYNGVDSYNVYAMTNIINRGDSYSDSYIRQEDENAFVLMWTKEEQVVQINNYQGTDARMSDFKFNGQQLSYQDWELRLNPGWNILMKAEHAENEVTKNIQINDNPVAEFYTGTGSLDAFDVNEFDGHTVWCDTYYSIEMSQYAMDMSRPETFFRLNKSSAQFRIHNEYYTTTDGGSNSYNHITAVGAGQYITIDTYARVQMLQPYYKGMSWLEMYNHEDGNLAYYGRPMMLEYYDNDLSVNEMNDYRTLYLKDDKLHFVDRTGRISIKALRNTDTEMEDCKYTPIKEDVNGYKSEDRVHDLGYGQYNIEKFQFLENGTKIQTTDDNNNKVITRGVDIPYNIKTINDEYDYFQLDFRVNDVSFSTDGSIVIFGISDNDFSNFTSYSLNTPFDIRTMDVESRKFRAHDNNRFYSSIWNPDGTEVVVTNRYHFYRYLLGTPWDIDTMSSTPLDGNGANGPILSVPEIDDFGSTYYYDMLFNEDGSKVYLLGNDYEIIVCPLFENYKIHSIDKMSMRSVGHRSYFGNYVVDSFDWAMDGKQLVATHGDNYWVVDLEIPYEITGFNLNERTNINLANTAPNTMIWNQDGTELITANEDNNRVYFYDILKPWEISTGKRNFTKIETIPYNVDNMQWVDNGNKLFIHISGTYLAFVMFDVPTAYDFESINFADLGVDGSNMISKMDTTSASIYPYSHNAIMSNDGKRITWLYGNQSNTIQTIELTNAYDVSYENLVNYKDISVHNGVNSWYLESFEFNSDMSQVIFTTNWYQALSVYDLVEAGDITKGVENHRFFRLDDLKSNQAKFVSFGNPDADGKYLNMYLNLSYSENKIKEYHLDEPDQIHILDTNNEAHYYDVLSYATGFTYNADGSKLYVINGGHQDKDTELYKGQEITQFTLTTPYDLNTMDKDYVSAPLHSGQGAWHNVTGIQFSEDGSKISLSTHYNELLIYDLPIAYDIESVGETGFNIGMNDELHINKIDLGEHGTELNYYNYCSHLSKDGKTFIMFNYYSTYRSMIQFNLETPWDATTAVFVGRTSPLTYSTDDSAPFFFSKDGLACYITNASNEIIEILLEEPYKFFNDIGEDKYTQTGKVQRIDNVDSDIYSMGISMIDESKMWIFDYQGFDSIDTRDYVFMESSFISYFSGQSNRGTATLDEDGNFQVIGDETRLPIPFEKADRLYRLDDYVHGERQYRPEYSDSFSAIAPILQTRMEEIQIMAVNYYDFVIVSDNIPEYDTTVELISTSGNVGTYGSLMARCKMFKYGDYYRLMDYYSNTLIPIYAGKLYFGNDCELNVPYRFLNDKEIYETGLVPLQEEILPMKNIGTDYKVNVVGSIDKYDKYKLQDVRAKCFDFRVTNFDISPTTLTSIEFVNKVVPKTIENMELDTLTDDDTFVEN